MKTKAAAKRFDPSRLARVANEPNLTSLVFGLMFGGGTHEIAVVFSALGAGLMVAICLAADAE
jgi:hypothetical protein